MLRCAGTKVKLDSKGRKPAFYTAGNLLAPALSVLMLDIIAAYTCQ